MSFQLILTSVSLSPTQQSSMLVAHTSMDQAGDGSNTGVVGTSLYLAPELFRPSTVKYTQVQHIHVYLYNSVIDFSIVIILCVHMSGQVHCT